MAVIIDDGRIVNDGGVTLYAIAMIVYAWRSNVLPVNKTPVVCRWIIMTERTVYTDAELGSQWRPAIIVATGSPTNPCRRPFISRYPKPPIIIIVKPAAVMEGRPAPVIIRSPHPPILICKNPMSVGTVRSEVGPHIGSPNISVFRVID